MKSQKANDDKIQKLNEALKVAKEIERKLQEFNDSSAKVAEKWQSKVEERVKKINN